MECAMRKTSDGINDESNLLEVEKLQRLVQSLQEENEKLMAAASSNVVQNGTENGSKRKITPSVDPPRDSGIDLSASCSDDLEDEILDLDRFDMPDDEECWLYSTTAVKSKEEDVLSWLRKDVNSLDPAARRALAVKLEMLIAKKNGENAKSDSKCSITHNAIIPDTVSTSSSIAAVLDFAEADDYHTAPSSAEKNNLSPNGGAGRVIARRTTFKVNKSPEAAAVAASNATTNNSATFNRPKKSPVVSNSASDELSLSKNGGQQNSTRQQQLKLAPAPALTLNGDSTATASSTSASPGRKISDALHSELNPDLHDIQLLASMQEEELRRCLQNLQQMNRRRRTSSGKDSDASPVTPQGTVAGVNIASVPVIPAKPSDRYATYTKPKQQLLLDPGVAALKAGSVVGRTANSTNAPTQPIQTQADASMSSQKGTGLQKSLPNLTGSRSEFNLPAPSFPADTASEKGSYGDIPSALNPPARMQAVTSSASRLAGPGSRLPTPSRSRLPTPSKSGISTSRTAALPVPMASKQRAKSPMARPSMSNSPKPGQGNWKEGCF